MCEDQRLARLARAIEQWQHCTCQPTFLWLTVRCMVTIFSTSWALLIPCTGGFQAGGADGSSPSRQCSLHTAAVADSDRLTRKGVMTEEVLQKSCSFQRELQIVLQKLAQCACCSVFCTCTFMTASLRQAAVMCVPE